MNTNKTQLSAASKYFIIFGVVVVSALLLSEFLTERLNLYDFRVMYAAAEAYLNDEAVYGVPFGLKTGYYKYSPFTMLAFTGYTLFGYKTASVIHFLIIGICAIGAILSLERLFRQYGLPVRRQSFWLFLGIFLSAFVHLFRDLHLGNINIILVMLLTIVLRLAITDRFMVAGFILAFVILAKPYFLICVLPFLAFRQWKIVLSTGVWMVIFIGITIVVMGWSESLRLHQEWFVAMMDHSSYLGSRHTLFSLADFYFGIAIPGRYAFLLFPVLALALTYYFYRHPRSSNERYSNLMLLFFLLIAIIPSVFITDTEHFLFSLPLIILLCFQRTQNAWWWTVLLVTTLVLYGGNSSDLLGKSLSRTVNQWGLLGISNLLLIGMSLFWFSRKEKHGEIKPDH